MPEAAPLRGTLLAFDFGLKRIGVAVGQTQTRTANALGILPGPGQESTRRIETLVEEWRPCALVVGLPLDREGGETEMSQRARQFGQELEEHTRLPVYFMDERLTSQAVETAFAAARAAGATRRKDAALKDAMAAKIILENWLQSLPANEPERA